MLPPMTSCLARGLYAWWGCRCLCLDAQGVFMTPSLQFQSASWLALGSKKGESAENIRKHKQKKGECCGLRFWTILWATSTVWSRFYAANLEGFQKSVMTSTVGKTFPFQDGKWDIWVLKSGSFVKNGWLLCYLSIGKSSKFPSFPGKFGKFGYVPAFSVAKF